MRTSPLIPLVCATVLVGCTHTFTVLPRQGDAQGQGSTTDVGRVVMLTLHEKRYTGFYEYSEQSRTIFDVLGRIIGGNSSNPHGSEQSRTLFDVLGSATETSVPQPSLAVGSDRGAAYVPGAGKGRILATAPDGEAIRCAFHALRRRSRGLCQDSAGMVYDLYIHK